MANMILAVDFDGTIAKHEFPRIGEEVPYCFKYLKRLQEMGVKLILYTMRSDGQSVGNVLTEAVEYCRKNGIEFWGVNVNPEQHTWTSSPKAYAHQYIDDNAIGCSLVYPTNEDRPYVNWKVMGPKLIKKAKEYQLRG